MRFFLHRCATAIAALFLFCSFSAAAQKECYIPFKTSWIEDTKDNGKLLLSFPNDRNLYISYMAGKSEIPISLSHRIYICNGKFLYLVTEDETVELYAAIENIDSNRMKLHFLKGNTITNTLDFTRKQVN